MVMRYYCLGIYFVVSVGTGRIGIVFWGRKNLFSGMWGNIIISFIISFIVIKMIFARIEWIGGKCFIFTGKFLCRNIFGLMIFGGRAGFGLQLLIIRNFYYCYNYYYYNEICCLRCSMIIIIIFENFVGNFIGVEIVIGLVFGRVCDVNDLAIGWGRWNCIFCYWIRL